MAENELERIYTIPLRKAHHGTRSKRANRAVRDVRDFLVRHMKSEQIWIDAEVNELLWARGKYTIPSKLRVRATRFDDGVVEVTLPESDAEGSIRAQIQERLEKAAETPILVPAGDEEEGEHTHDEEALGRPVTDVTGIGPKAAEKLEAIGITNLGELAAADVEKVAEATGHSVEAVQPWLDQAHSLLHDEEE